MAADRVVLERNGLCQSAIREKVRDSVWRNYKILSHSALTQIVQEGEVNGERPAQIIVGNIEVDYIREDRHCIVSWYASHRLDQNQREEDPRTQ